MVYKGFIKGKLIKLAERLPYPDGQAVKVFVEPLVELAQVGLPAAIRLMMHEPPHLTGGDVDELERAALVSRDRDFQHIDGLQVEDWTV